MYKQPRPQIGFTLIELMVTLAIGAILIATAVPSMREIIQNNRSVTQVNELQAALNLGRSEAIKRGSSITVCQSNTGTACTGEWQGGWIVFNDANADGVVDNGEEVLRVHNGLADGVTLRFTGTRITYIGNGLADIGSDQFFIHCDSRREKEGRGVLIGPTGRARVFVKSDFAEIIADNDWVNSITCT